MIANGEKKSLLCSRQQRQTDLLYFKSHLQLKVGLIEELLAENGGVLIDGSQEHSEMRENHVSHCLFNKDHGHVLFIHFNLLSYLN